MSTGRSFNLLGLYQLLGAKHKATVTDEPGGGKLYRKEWTCGCIASHKDQGEIKWLACEDHRLHFRGEAG